MKMTLAACAVFQGLCLAAVGSPENTVLHAQLERMRVSKDANAAHVKADCAEAGLPQGSVVHYEVPALSDVMRVADTYPIDGTVGGTVGATLAQGEFECASFELFAFEDLDGVELKLSGLTGPGGSLEADLRVVKVWLQNGNGWVSYFDDAGLKLVPELLLHDENLIEVDLKREANYARVYRNGRTERAWISAPRGLDAGFDAYDPGFRDADVLQPVRLEKNAFKQFVLTIHAKKDQKPGVYRGAVTVGRTGLSVPVAACVLPFELPMPRGYLKDEQPYVYGCMSALPPRDLLRTRCGDVARGDALFRRWAQSLYDHSVFHAPYVTRETVGELPLLREIGFPLDVVFGESKMPWFGLNFGGRMSFVQLMQMKRASDEDKAFYEKNLPGATVLVGYGDEQGAGFVTAHREAFEYYAGSPVKVGCAGHEALMNKGGYAYGYYPMGGEPDNFEKARPWHELGNEPVGFYASQHTGSENPQFVRMQHGLLSYFSGLTMTYNYLFDTDGWNDRGVELYKPMVVTYACGDGLMETLAYAGFREGCDDIRYATCLKGLVREAEAGASARAKVVARRALQYLALLKRDRMDLNAVRAEMIEHILKIRAELGK